LAGGTSPDACLDQAVVVLQFTEKPLRDVGIAEIGTGERACHCGDRVGVVAGVHSGEQCLLEVIGTGQEAPESAGKGLQDVGAVVPIVKRRPPLFQIARQLAFDRLYLGFAG
jgi:hypothetical protein